MKHFCIVRSTKDVELITLIDMVILFQLTTVSSFCIRSATDFAPLINPRIWSRLPAAFQKLWCLLMADTNLPFKSGKFSALVSADKTKFKRMFWFRKILYPQNGPMPFSLVAAVTK